MKEMLAPIDYFRMAGQPNPRELAKNFILWQEDPYSFFQDDEDVMAMLKRKSDAEMAGVTGEAPVGAPANGVEPDSTEPTAMGVANALRAATEGGMQ